MLRQNSLMIYKDQTSQKSFPTKPLYCIPIDEIEQVEIGERLLYPNQRKNDAIYSLEIHLKDTYGVIAMSIAQLMIMGVMPFNGERGSIIGQGNFNQSIMTNGGVIRR